MADAAEFVSFFEEGWRKAKPDAFIEHFGARLTEDVRLVQPMTPDAVGPAAFEALFRRVFEIFPDYEVRVEDWAGANEVVYLWLTHETTIGRRRVSWPGVDRVVLAEDGRLRERVALFDPSVQLPALVRAPRLWLRLARLGRGV